MSTGWTDDELDRIGGAEELQIATQRPDGSLDRYTTIWVVRIGDDLYVRSVRGAHGAWYGKTLRTRTGRIRSGGIERDVSVTQPADAPHAAIDEAYRTKYARHGPAYVEPMTAGPATAATLRLDPR